MIDPKMYETVKVVNGIRIVRAVGVRGFYDVIIKEIPTNKGTSRMYCTFRTLKSAIAFIENGMRYKRR